MYDSPPSDRYPSLQKHTMLLRALLLQREQCSQGLPTAIPEILQGYQTYVRDAWGRHKHPNTPTHFQVFSRLCQGSSGCITSLLLPALHSSHESPRILLKCSHCHDFLQPKQFLFKVNGSAYPIIFAILSLKPILEFCLQ